MEWILVGFMTPNTLDIQLKQKQEDWLDSVDRQAIVAAVNKSLKKLKVSI